MNREALLHFLFVSPGILNSWNAVIFAILAVFVFIVFQGIFVVIIAICFVEFFFYCLWVFYSFLFWVWILLNFLTFIVFVLFFRDFEGLQSIIQKWNSFLNSDILFSEIPEEIRNRINGRYRYLNVGIFLLISPSLFFFSVYLLGKDFVGLFLNQ